MKEKRYYCDWVLSSGNEKSYRLIFKVMFISLIVVTAISTLIYYDIMKNNFSKNLEAHSESAYQYLDETTDNVIGENEPSFSSKEKFETSHIAGFFIASLILGILTWGVIAIAICMVMGFAIIISMLHKAMYMKKIFHKGC